MTTTENKIPKVFISYSWTSAQHEKWVERLAKDLKENGVEVRLDKWHLKEGQSIHKFMEEMVVDESVDRVLIVSDHRYAKKSDDREGGVGTETEIITPQVYGKVDQTKYLPIVRERDEEGDPYLPTYLLGRLYYDFSDNEMYVSQLDRLLRDIHGEPLYVEPPLGERPIYPDSEAESSNNRIRITWLTFTNAVASGSQGERILFRNFIDELARIIEEYRIGELDQGVHLDDVVIERIEDYYAGLRPIVLHMYDYIAVNFGDDKFYWNQIKRLLESIYAFIPRTGSKNSFTHYEYYLYELFLYWMGILIRERNTEAFRFFSDARYLKKQPEGTIIDEPFVAFFGYLGFIDDTRKRRIESRHYSISRDMLVENLDGSYLSLAEMLQVDFLLALRSFVDEDIRGFWPPRTMIYIGSIGTFPLFQEASGKQAFDELLMIVGIESRDTLLERIGDEKFITPLYRISERNIYNLENLLNLEHLWNSE